MPDPCDIDFLRLDDLLNEQERAIRSRVRELVDREVLPHIAGWYEKGQFPRHLIPQMAKLGLPGMKLKAFGGASSIAYGLACRELERGDSGLRSFLRGDARDSHADPGRGDHGNRCLCVTSPFACSRRQPPL